VADYWTIRLSASRAGWSLIMNERDAQSFYLNQAVAVAERILGLGDRDPSSATYGCFDRYYWHYKALDFPNARAQEIGYYLGLLWKHPFEGNRFAGVNNVRSWAEAAVDFWYQIQNRDGSFNEWWPHERSFCATSFSTMLAAQTVRLLGLSPNRQVFFRAAQWLRRNDNPDVSNQVAASALALRCVGDLLEDESLIERAEQRARELIQRQGEDGHFPEYGGADVGYHSLTVSLLAAYLKHSASKAVSAVLPRAFEFLQGRLAEDASFDYKSCSRRTQFLYPSGFLLMEQSDLIHRHLRGCRAGTVLLPSWMDDRYCFQLATDYLVAGLTE